MGWQTRRGIDNLLWVVALAALGASAIAMQGCTKAPLAPTEERSPFDRYDAVRGNFAPQYVEDKFGRRQPNLQGRLSPKE